MFSQLICLRKWMPWKNAMARRNCYRLSQLFPADYLRWLYVLGRGVVKSSNPSTTVFPYNGYMRIKYSRNINCYPWKQPTFRDATAGFTATSSLINERRNSTMMTRHYKDLQPIRSSTHGQIWVVKRHHNGISASQAIFLRLQVV